MIEKAGPGDIARIAEIYEAIHDEEAAGRTTTGWIRGVYPRRETAEAALSRGDLYVNKGNGHIAAAAVINHIQPEAYESGHWTVDASGREVLVLHTLTVDPEMAGRGYGRSFVDFYEQMGRTMGCRVLRMDTNARNRQARAMYAHLGYKEVGIVPTTFNGIPDVYLVLLEKDPWKSQRTGR